MTPTEVKAQYICYLNMYWSFSTIRDHIHLNL